MKSVRNTLLPVLAAVALTFLMTPTPTALRAARIAAVERALSPFALPDAAREDQEKEDQEKDDPEKDDEEKEDKDDEDDKKANEEDAGASFDVLEKKFEAEKSKAPYERFETIEAFGFVKSPRTVPFLVGLLGSESNPLLHASAIKALGRQGSAKAVQAIVERGIPLVADDPLNLPAVSQALSNELEPKAEKWLLRNGLNPRIRKQAPVVKVMVQAIAGLKDEGRFKVLSKELRKAGDPGVIVAVLTVFRDYQPDNAEKDALALLKSRDTKVQAASLEVLLAVRATSSTVTKKCAPLVKSKSWEIRVLTIDLLALAGHKKLVSIALPRLEDRDKRVRIAAIGALVDSGDPKVVEPLIAAIDKNTGRVQDDIVDALIRLTGENLGYSSAQWESWWTVKKGQVQIRKRTQDEFAEVKIVETEEKDTAVYHGIRVLSDRCAFIVDTSESMKERYRYRDRDDEKGPKGRQGPTVVKDPKKRGDRSSEFAGLLTKMNVAKRELAKVLDSLRNGVFVNIIRFDTLIQPWRPELHELDPQIRKDARRFVDASRPEGLTNLYGAIELTFQDEEVDTIYLLSDGAPTNGKYTKPNDVLKAVENLNRLRKVKINTIGFNLKAHEKKLLKDLAEAHGGIFISR